MSRQLICRLRIIRLVLHGGPLASEVLPLHSRNQVDEEGEGVECEDESYGPFEACGDVVVLFRAGDAEGNGECDFNDDENELDPEGGAKDAVLAEIWQWC